MPAEPNDWEAAYNSASILRAQAVNHIKAGLALIEEASAEFDALSLAAENAANDLRTFSQAVADERDQMTTAAESLKALVQEEN